MVLSGGLWSVAIVSTVTAGLRGDPSIGATGFALLALISSVAALSLHYRPDEGVVAAGDSPEALKAQGTVQPRGKKGWIILLTSVLLGVAAIGLLFAGLVASGPLLAIASIFSGALAFQALRRGA